MRLLKSVGRQTIFPDYHLKVYNKGYMDKGNVLGLENELMVKVYRYRWLVFSLLALGYLFVFFHRLCPAVLAVDIMNELGTSGPVIGLLAASYFYPYALMQLPAGLLSDSWGPRKTVTVFFVLASIGSLIMAVSSTIFWIIVGRTLVGIGVAMLFVPTMKILAEWFHHTEFAYMTGILFAVGGIGSLIAASPLVWLTAQIGWRNSFLVISGITFVIAILIGIFVRNRPSEFGWPTPVAASHVSDVSIGLMEGIKIVLSNKKYWPLFIWFFCDYGVFVSFGGLWGGPYLIQVYQMSKAEAGKILSMIAIGMGVGSLTLSYLSDNIFKKRKPVLILSTAIMLVITGVLFIYPAQIAVIWLYIIYFSVGIFSGATVVIGFTMNKELFPIQMAGTATGLINLAPFMGGAVLQPLLGFMLESSGSSQEAYSVTAYQSAFLILLIATIMAFFASLFTKETLKFSESG